MKWPIFFNGSFDLPSGEDRLLFGWVILAVAHTHVVQQLISLPSPEAMWWSESSAWPNQKYKTQPPLKKADSVVRKEWLECKGGGKVCAWKGCNIQMLKKTMKGGEKNRQNNPTLIKQQVSTAQQSATIDWLKINFRYIRNTYCYFIVIYYVQFYNVYIWPKVF